MRWGGGFCPRRGFVLRQQTRGGVMSGGFGRSYRKITGFARSLQKVQGHRTAQGHRAGVDVDVTPPTGGRVGHPPNPATLCDRSAQGSKS